MHRIYHPTPWNYISHRYATEVNFQIYEMGPLDYYMADDFFIPNPPLIIGSFHVKSPHKFNPYLFDFAETWYIERP